MILREGEVVFSPADTTWVLSGHAVNNRIEAVRSSPGVNHITYTTRLNATLNEARITGTYTTSTCNYAVQLTQF